MSLLILVRHSQPDIDPNIPSREWRLSEEGHRRCQMLARQLEPYEPELVLTSNEPKAGETASHIAVHFNLPWQIVQGLHEHDRANEAFGSQQQFQAAVSAFFARPTELVFGLENAEQAQCRFVAAVDRSLKSYPDQNVVIVSHGTVMSLHVAASTRLDPHRIWKELDVPAFIVMSRPELRLLELAGRVH